VATEGSVATTVFAITVALEAPPSLITTKFCALSGMMLVSNREVPPNKCSPPMELFEMFAAFVTLVVPVAMAEVVIQRWVAVSKKNVMGPMGPAPPVSVMDVVSEWNSSIMTDGYAWPAGCNPSFTTIVPPWVWTPNGGLTGVVTVQVLGYQNENPKLLSVYCCIPATATPVAGWAGAVGAVGWIGTAGDTVLTGWVGATTRLRGNTMTAIIISRTIIMYGYIFFMILLYH